MRLILIRHGETNENVLGIIQGHLPGTLSQEGIMQAKKSALRLKNEHLDFIYSSDLARSSDTANEIVKYHPDIPLQFTQELREQNLGELQGRKEVELGRGEKELMAKLDEPKEGETKKQLFDRANTFLDKLLNKHKNDAVLLVGHDGINREIISAILGKGQEQIKQIKSLKNAGISIFEIDEGKKTKVLLLDSSEHL